MMRKLFLAFVILFISMTSTGQLKIGSKVPEIVLPNGQDSLVKLSTFEGKIVFIDFWASWCGPCRQANPSVQKLYKQYHKKGFEVFAVSLDVNKAAWLKAIKKDRLTYTQVYDRDGWNSKIAEDYFIDALPTNFLIDKAGRIVAINLEGKALFDAVAQLTQ